MLAGWGSYKSMHHLLNSCDKMPHYALQVTTAAGHSSVQQNMHFPVSHVFNPDWPWIGCGALWPIGSVCDIQARDHGFNPQLQWICSYVVLLGKALCSHMHSLHPGVNGYLEGQWRHVCLSSSVCWKWQRGCMLLCSPGSWDGLWMNRSCDLGVIVWSWVNGALRYIPD